MARRFIRSSIRRPVSDSTTGGTCAMTLATSPVMREMPSPPLPAPVLTIVIWSMRESGSATARAISGRIGARICITAASLYLRQASAFFSMASASARPCAFAPRPRRGPGPARIGPRPALGLHGLPRPRSPRAFSPSATAVSRVLLGLGLGLDLHAVGGGDRLHLVALGVGLALDRGVELLLPAADLLLLDLDLHRLLLELEGHLGLGPLAVRDRLLLGDRLLGLVSSRSRRRGGPWRPPPSGAAPCRRSPRPRPRRAWPRPPAPAAWASAWRWRVSRSASACAIDGLLGGHGLGDRGRALDLGDPRLAERLEVAVLVADVADREGVDAEAHVREVAGRDLLDLLGELVAVLVDVLDRQRAEDGAQVALHGLERDLRDLLGFLPRKRSAAACSEASSFLILICATPSTMTGTPCEV